MVGRPYNIKSQTPFSDSQANQKKNLGLLCSYLPTKIGPTPQKILPFSGSIFFPNPGYIPMTDTAFRSLIKALGAWAS